MNRKALIVWLVLILVTACTPTTPTGPDLNATATQEALNIAATLTALAFPTPTALVPVTSTTTVEPLPIPSETPLPPTVPPQGEQQFLAYIRDGQLLVTDVTNGAQGGTTQYTLAGESDQVTELVWSPSGEFVAFVSAASGAPHVFYIFALGQSSPTDLGPGSAPAWSPDSQSLAYVGGAYPDENISVTTIENPSPRQLTFESNYAWGRPAFMPDGSALVVAGASRDNMGASGNTSFTLESLSLDGSGTRTPIPGATPFEGGRLPYDLRFSPHGTKLAFSTSYHLSACASPGAYYIVTPGSPGYQELISPALKSFLDPVQEHYHVGLSYAWTSAGDGILALGNVVDCKIDSPTAGQVIAGPQMSRLGLDGSEGLIIPGFFYGMSMDRSGAFIAAAHFQDGFQDLNPNVEIYSAQTGQLVLPLGPGSNPQFQP